MFEDLTTEDLTPESRKKLATELSGKLAGALKPEPISSVVSLRKVELELAELGELLELAIERRSEVTSATTSFAYEPGELEKYDAEIDAIGRQIGAYLKAEVAKVDSYHGFIKTGVNLIGELKAEEERLRRCRKAWETAIERVKGAAVYVLQAMGKKRLEGSHGRRLRLHPTNPSVEVTDAGIVPDEFLRVTCEMNLVVWHMLTEMFPGITGMERKATDISLSRIKAFMEAGQECPECDLVSACNEPPCERCNGTGRIPGHVPGARLVRDAMHLRVE